MIAVGAAMVGVGYVLMALFGTRSPLFHNHADYIGAWTVLCGVALVFVKIVMLLWRFA